MIIRCLRAVHKHRRNRFRLFFDDKIRLLGSLMDAHTRVEKREHWLPLNCHAEDILKVVG
jgi:hypothetical protein